MEHITYSELRQNLASIMDRVCDDRAPLVVTRQNARPVVMLSLEEYESSEATLHLTSTPANAAGVRESIAQAEAGQLAFRNPLDGDDAP